jgi:Tol biopolymer transport system component
MIRQYDNDAALRAFLADEAERAEQLAPSIEHAVAVLTPRLRRSSGQRKLVLLLAAALVLTAVVASAVVIGSAPPWEDSSSRVEHGLVAYVRARDVYVRDLAAGDDRLLIRGDRTRPNDGTFYSRPHSVAFSPNGERIAFLRGVHVDNVVGSVGTLWVANADGSQDRLAWRLFGVEAFAWSPDSRRLAAVTTASNAPQVDIIDLDDPTGGHWSVQLPAGAPKLRDVQWSSDGASLFVWNDVSSVLQVDLDDGSVATLLEGRAQRHTLDMPSPHFAVSSDGRFIVTVSSLQRGTLGTYLIELSSGQVHEAHEEPLLIPAFSPDGAWLAGIGSDDLVVGRAAEFADRARRVTGIDPQGFVFAPDSSSILAVGSGQAWLYDLESRRVQTLPGDDIWPLIQDMQVSWQALVRE